MRIFGNRNLEDIAIVDNAGYSYAYQVDNGIPIIPFYDNKKDDELKTIVSYIKTLAKNDIRETNKNTFKLHYYRQCKTIEEIENILF